MPDIAFIVGSPRIGREIQQLLATIPMNFVIYTLDFDILTSLPALFKENALKLTEAIRVEVSRVNSKGLMEPFPSPWLISARYRAQQLLLFIFRYVQDIG